MYHGHVLRAKTLVDRVQLGLIQAFVVRRLLDDVFAVALFDLGSGESLRTVSLEEHLKQLLVGRCARFIKFRQRIQRLLAPLIRDLVSHKS